MMVPGANHGMGGAYGQRRMNDFFVRHLLGSEPPSHNDDSAVSRASVNGAPARPSGELVSLDLEDVNLDRSELRGAIERFSTDRRSFTATSAGRLARA